VPWLTLLVAVPLVGSLVALARPGRPGAAKAAALAFALVELVLAVVVATRFSTGGGQYQLTESYSWVRSFGLSWALGLDGISLALVAMTAVITPVVIAAGWRDADGSGQPPGGFFACILLTEAMLVGAFLAVDVLLFYILFEAMLIPMYILVGVYGGPRRAQAATKFLIYNLFGGLVMLAAVIGLYVTSAQGGRTGTFSLAQLVQIDIPTSTQYWLFAGFMIAFAIKAPLWPFHTWLPDTAEQTSPAGAAYLSGVVDKVGTFGMIHLVLPLFPDASRTLAPVVVVLAVISIIYGAVLAVAQRDMQRFVACTSISHFGFIVLGIFALTTQGGTGATLYMVNHALSTVLLFLVVGYAAARRGSRDWRDFGGLQRPAPLLAGVFLVAALASLSLPGLATFVSEFLVLVGTYTRYPAAAIVATVAIVLAAVYALLMYQRVFTGPTTPRLVGARDLVGREALVVAPLVVLLVVLGFYPKPLADVVDHGVTPTLSQTGVTDPRPATPVAAGSTERGSR